MMRLSKTWKTPRVVLGLFIAEFAGTVAALALFGIAAPDMYRTALWKDGARNGFNSDPAQILYAYANYRPIPKTPLVWSSLITNYNVIIAVFSMFILLIKAVLNVMHLFYPIISLIVHLAITALWAVSVYGQAGPDKSDPKHPSSVPWYLAKSCSVVFDQRNLHNCKMAKSVFAVTVVMLAIFVAHIPLALYSLFTKKGKKHSRNASEDSQAVMTKESPDSEYSYAKRWELGAVPRTPTEYRGKSREGPQSPMTPVTPRTQAFNRLNHPLPLRSSSVD
ncbi:MAG: hypothetical protein M1833_001254 [Piccolia ochrophora]|nr:MAG: hypothetical protein M1833_001254 [Piccolia ochrophora]